MADLAAIFIGSLVIALSGAMMPGPLLTATIGEAGRRGFLAGPLLILGHGLLELVLVVALFLGLAPFLRGKWAFVVIALAGAAILLWMAVGMLRALPSLTISWDARAAASPGPLVINGAILSLANPYWTVWWATIGVAYMLQSSRFGLTGVVVFFAGHILGDLAWYAAVSAAVDRGRRFFTDRVYRALIAACAVFLILFALLFVYAAVRRAWSQPRASQPRPTTTPLTSTRHICRPSPPCVESIVTMLPPGLNRGCRSHRHSPEYSRGV